MFLVKRTEVMPEVEFLLSEDGKNKMSLDQVLRIHMGPPIFLSLVQKFQLRLLCRNCCQQYALDPLLVVRTDFEHKCARDLVVGPVSGQVFILVREPKREAGIEFMLCKFGPILNCEYRDGCSFAHSLQEVEIWNAIKFLGSTFLEFTKYLRGLLCKT